MDWNRKTNHRRESRELRMTGRRRALAKLKPSVCSEAENCREVFRDRPAGDLGHGVHAGVVRREHDASPSRDNRRID